MKIKLHLGIFILLFTFLGTYLEHNNVHNQQIVIQFSDDNVALEDANSTIEAIKEKLQSIGVKDIQIGQHYKGQLKITYYSDVNVSLIQDILNEEGNFKLSYETGEKESHNLPEDRDANDYELNISEIQNISDVNWDFDGTQVIQLNQKSDRFSYPKLNNSANENALKLNNSIVNTTILVNNSIAMAIDHISFKIPEVRAGPSS